MEDPGEDEEEQDDAEERVGNGVPNSLVTTNRPTSQNACKT